MGPEILTNNRQSLQLDNFGKIGWVLFPAVPICPAHQMVMVSGTTASASTTTAATMKHLSIAHSIT